MHTVIVPAQNEPDVKEFIEEIDTPPQLVFAKTMDDVIAVALTKKAIVSKKK